MTSGHNVKPGVHIRSCDLAECIVHVPCAPFDGGVTTNLRLEAQEPLCKNQAHLCGRRVDLLENVHCNDLF
jgi:hypothetical protein